MAVNEKFPVPVSGQPIPKGWFAKLVRFINSLVLSGDEQYVMVKRTDGGTTITLTPSFVNSLKNAAAPAAGGGGDYVPGPGINITGNTISSTITQGTPLPVSDPSRRHSIRLDQYYVMQHDGWARMTAIIDSIGESGYLGYTYLRVTENGTNTDHLCVACSFTVGESSIGGSVMVPVVSGSTISAYLDLHAGDQSIDIPSLPNEILVYD